MACARSIGPFTRHVWRFCGHVDPTGGVDVVEGVEVTSSDLVDSTQSLASTKNPFPPRNVAAAAVPLRLFGRALHAFARGPVLFGEMLVFGAIPTGLQLERACGLFFIGTADALGHRCWCLAIPWGALPSLGFGGRGQRGQN